MPEKIRGAAAAAAAGAGEGASSDVMGAECSRAPRAAARSATIAGMHPLPRRAG